MKILIVDDEPHIREMLGRFLESEGYVVETAENGQVGLAAAGREGEKPDLIILDNKMPVLSGIGMLEALRGNGSQIPVIMITGHSELDTEALKRLAVVNVMEKPFSFDQIAEVITRLGGSM